MDQQAAEEAGRLIPLRPGLPPLPDRMAQLPKDHRGYPVPWFVAWVDGKPDFRIVDPAKMDQAIHHPICWLCGQHLDGDLVFVIGPMCAVNRTSSEPPSHPDCAAFAARACPFLTMPKAERREGNLPQGMRPAAGFGLKRNPGVTLLWTCLAYRWLEDQNGRKLFQIGAPVRIEWLAEGRQATRAEVLESINSGLPLLMAPAKQEGPRAVKHLQQLTEAAMALVPAA